MKFGKLWKFKKIWNLKRHGYTINNEKNISYGILQYMDQQFRYDTVHYLYKFFTYGKDFYNHIRVRR